MHFGILNVVIGALEKWDIKAIQYIRPQDTYATPFVPGLPM